MLVLIIVVAAGCEGGRSATAPQAQTGDPGVVHIHGLGINPADGALYAATHTGLFVVRDGGATRVADRFQDTMGFTVAGPDHFLGSGHPDIRDRHLFDPNRRPLLGLIESHDSGRTWRPLSLLGEADFHALHLAHGRVYGYDATGNRLMVTSDRRRWQVRSKVALVDFAVSPADSSVIVAATERGLVLSTDGGRGWRSIPGPKAAMLQWEGPDALWVMTADGETWQSGDAGKRWVRHGELNGQPEAFLVHGRTLYAAVSQLGIVSSSDGGRTWRTLYRPDLPTG